MTAAFGIDIRHRLSEGLLALGLEADERRLSLLLGFLALLRKWNKAYNLTAVDDPAQMVTRHLLDSLSIAPHLCGQRILDVGSGAGLPAIPLAIWFPEREFHLLDSNGKKMRFLFQVRLGLELPNVSLHQSRVESMTDERGFDCVTSRAFADLRGIIRASAHLMAPGGCLLAMKGALDDEELRAVTSPYTVASRTQLAVPGITGERQILKIIRQDTATQ